MTIYAVYEVRTGSLVSFTSDAGQLETAEVYEARRHAVAERPDSEAGGVWDRTLLRFVPRAVEPVALTEYQFLARMPAERRVVLRQLAKVDPIIEDFMAMLSAADTVVPGDQATTMAIGYLVQQGHLSEAEAGVILTPGWLPGETP